MPGYRLVCSTIVLVTLCHYLQGRRHSRTSQLRGPEISTTLSPDWT